MIFIVTGSWQKTTTKKRGWSLAARNVFVIRWPSILWVVHEHTLTLPERDSTLVCSQLWLVGATAMTDRRELMNGADKRKQKSRSVHTPALTLYRSSEDRIKILKSDSRQLELSWGLSPRVHFRGSHQECLSFYGHQTCFKSTTQQQCSGVDPTSRQTRFTIF